MDSPFKFYLYKYLPQSLAFMILPSVWRHRPSTDRTDRQTDRQSEVLIHFYPFV